MNVGGQGIAWLAHIGGFLLGILLIKWWRKKQGPVVEILQ
jgi:membrane associated rhomboid family serine protease